jgi:hypothetical protein
MAWKCPSCGFDQNEDSVVRCVCGYELPPVEYQNQNYERVGGLLLLVACGLSLSALINGILIARSAKVEYVPLIVVVIEWVSALFYVALPIVLLIILFLKKKFFPKMMVSFLILHLIVAIMAYFGWKYVYLRDAASFGKSFYFAKGVLMSAVIGCCVWIPYFFISERVKKTFVR